MSITDNIANPSSEYQPRGRFREPVVQRTDALGDDLRRPFRRRRQARRALEALQALPGGLVERLKVGTDMTRFDPTPDSLTALARVAPEKNVHFFDAGLSADPPACSGTRPRTVELGDGKTGTGQVIHHAYDSPGDHEVVLTATRNAKSDTLTIRSTDPVPTLLSLVRRGRQTGRHVILRRSGRNSGPRHVPGERKLRLTDDNYVSLDRIFSTHLRALDKSACHSRCSATTAAAGTGRIMQITSSWMVKMDARGDLVFERDEQRRKNIRARLRHRYHRTLWHDVTIAYDADDGVASIRIDGARAAPSPFSGSTQAYQRAWRAARRSVGHDFNGELGAVDIIADPGSGAAESRSRRRRPVE